MKALLALALLWPFAASPARAQTFGAAQVQSQLPLDYVQSGFMVGLQGGGFPGMPADLAGKTQAVSKMAREFQGSEILLTDLRTPQALQDIRDGITAIRTVSQSSDPTVNARRKPFDGYYIVSRPLGFFWPGEVPAQWTANALKTDGSVHHEEPCYDSANLGGCGSISMNGWTFDVGNSAAVAAFLQKNAQAFSASCSPSTSCVGPLYGYVAFNETTLSGNYGNFLNGPAYSDMSPADYTQTDNHLKYPKLGDPAGPAPGYWMIDAMLGNPNALPNGDAFMSYLHGPKRMIPLFSSADRDAFVAFARAKLPVRTDIDKLPADRWEFDYDSSALKLADPGPLGPNGWVKFVPLSDADYWNVWEDWVYQTWTGFLTGWAQSFAQAQAGNPDFKGSLYFDFPGWWSLRGADAQASVTYSYLDTATGQKLTATRRALDAPDDGTGHPAYKALNPVARGTDLGVILRSPYFAGFLHETTNEMPGPKDWNLPRAQLEDSDYNRDMHRYLFMMMGEAAKELARANGKLFGAFVRWGTIGLPNDAPSQMPVDLFQKVNYERLIEVLKPDVVSTIPPGIYLSPTDPPAGQSGCSGPYCYQQTWLDGLARLSAVRAGQTPPPWTPPVTYVSTLKVTDPPTTPAAPGATLKAYVDAPTNTTAFSPDDLAARDKVKSVEFVLDGTSLGRSTQRDCTACASYTGYYSFVLAHDFTGAQPGAHTLLARSYDALPPGGSQIAVSAAFTITLAASGSARVTLDSPVDGASVTGTVNVSGSYPCDPSQTISFFATAPDNFLDFRSPPASLDKTCGVHGGHPNTFGWSASFDPWMNGSFLLEADARDASGTVVSTTGAHVNVSGAAVPTAALTAAPPAITQGQSSTLSWSSTNASSCVLDGISGGPSGSRTVSPAATRSYSLTCTNGSQSASASATVTVNPVPPPSGPVTVHTLPAGADVYFVNFLAPPPGAMVDELYAGTSDGAPLPLPSGADGLWQVWVDTPGYYGAATYPNSVQPGQTVSFTLKPLDNVVSGPTVTLLHQRNRDTLSGTIMLEAHATPFFASGRIARVDYAIGRNGSSEPVRLLATPTTPPFTATFNTAELADGDYLLYAFANEVTSTTSGGGARIVGVTLKNGAASALPAPVVSNVQVSQITTTSATVSWTTNVPSDGKVMWSWTGAVGGLTGDGSPLDPALATTHSVRVGGLMKGQTYHFRVFSAAGGLEGSSPDATFQTPVSDALAAQLDRPFESAAVSGAAAEVDASVCGEASRVELYEDGSLLGTLSASSSASQAASPLAEKR